MSAADVVEGDEDVTTGVDGGILVVEDAATDGGSSLADSSTVTEDQSSGPLIDSGVTNDADVTAQTEQGGSQPVTLGEVVITGTPTKYFYGVPDGKIMASFDQKRGSKSHGGIDVTSGSGSAVETRGQPIYIAIHLSIPLGVINSAKSIRYDGKDVSNELQLPQSGLAAVERIISRAREPGNEDYDYGGIVQLNALYNFSVDDETAGKFTVTYEYYHLIIKERPPKTIDKAKNIVIIPIEEYEKQGGLYGIDQRMRSGQLTAKELSEESILIGYIGATQGPHVHIQARFKKGHHTTGVRKNEPGSFLIDPEPLLIA